MGGCNIYSGVWENLYDDNEQPEPVIVESEEEEELISNCWSIDSDTWDQLYDNADDDAPEMDEDWRITLKIGTVIGALRKLLPTRQTLTESHRYCHV